MLNTNPFAPRVMLEDERGVYADGASLRRSYFVHREIEFTRPIAAVLVYDGWWFRQRVSIDGIVVWRRISWTTFHNRIEFELPAEIDPNRSPVRIDIRFGPGLGIRRFQVTLGGLVVYDEIV